MAEPDQIPFQRRTIRHEPQLDLEITEPIDRIDWRLHVFLTRDLLDHFLTAQYSNPNGPEREARNG